uniref:Uncharacterized protein n=1 Tax=Meloidogyne incognita TaxID=6306 RepID=A0A914MIF2_MELIC
MAAVAVVEVAVEHPTQFVDVDYDEIAPVGLAIVKNSDHQFDHDRALGSVDGKMDEYPYPYVEFVVVEHQNVDAVVVADVLIQVFLLRNILLYEKLYKAIHHALIDKKVPSKFQIFI